MRRLALLAALAIAPSSVASAQAPDRDRARDRDRDGGWYDDRYDDREGRWYDDREGRWYDDREGRWYDRDRDRLRWRPIAEHYSASSERQFINVLGRGGRYRRLLIEGVRGAPVIERVAVEFSDRQTQVWDLNRRLRRGADEVIHLGGPRRIHRIVVYTNPAYRGSYSIYGA